MILARYLRVFRMLAISNKFIYQPISRVTHTNGVRHYIDPVTNSHVPSVTTILDKTSDKSGLLEWRKFVGDKRADETRDNALALGDLVHKNIEDRILGRPIVEGSNLIHVKARKMAGVIVDNITAYLSEIWGSEVALLYPDLFGGTTDLIGVYKGKPAIMDFKTAKKLRSRSEITDYFLQLSAYILAHDQQYDTQIKYAVIFMVDHSMKFACYEIDAKDILKYTEIFMQRIEQYHQA